MEAAPTTYTWNDYLAFDDDLRRELVGGEIVEMSPGASSRHQQLVLRLAASLMNKLNSKDHQVFVAPLDVKLSDTDVVQPDVMICESAKVKERFVDGAPTLVAEVLSPSTQAHDRVRKLSLYAQYGVEEYWIVQPDSNTLEQLRLQEGRYVLEQSYAEDGLLVSRSFPDLKLELGELFRE